MNLQQDHYQSRSLTFESYTIDLGPMLYCYQHPPAGGLVTLTALIGGCLGSGIDEDRG